MRRYAIITGAASGMGRIHARRLSEAGYACMLVDINAGGLESLKAELEGDGHICVVQDLTAEDAVANIRAAADKAGADVRILVNNAGMIFTTEIILTAPEKLRAMIMLHCTTPLLLCREFLPDMTAAGEGRILNISSITAWMDWPMIGMYGNTKRFIKGYSRSLRMETKGSGVTVTTAIFGAVDTPLFGFTEKARRKMKRWGVMITPEQAVEKAQSAMIKGKKKVTPGLLNKIAVPVVSIIPDWLLMKLYRKFRHLLIKG